MLAAARTIHARLLSLSRKVDWIGPLAVRLVLGLVFVATGWGKLHDLDSVTQFFTSLHIPAAHANAVLVSSVELAGGAMLILGLGTRIAALVLVAVMAVAIWTAKLPAIHGLADLAGTLELAYLAAFVWLALAGPGRASADHLLACSCAPA